MSPGDLIEVTFARNIGANIDEDEGVILGTWGRGLIFVGTPGLIISMKHHTSLQCSRGYIVFPATIGWIFMDENSVRDVE
jgi:hypothetical protein